MTDHPMTIVISLNDGAVIPNQIYLTELKQAVVPRSNGAKGAAAKARVYKYQLMDEDYNGSVRSVLVGALNLRMSTIIIIAVAIFTAYVTPVSWKQPYTYTEGFAHILSGIIMVTSNVGNSLLMLWYGGLGVLATIGGMGGGD